MGSLDEVYAAKNQVADSLESDVIGKLRSAIDDLEDCAGTLANVGGDVSTTLQEVAAALRHTMDRVEEDISAVAAAIDTTREWHLG
jgi:ABC-type transporter Mla subunit MlaD